MKKTNQKEVRRAVEAHVLEVLRHEDEWGNLPEADLLKAFWHDYKSRVYRPGIKNWARKANRWMSFEVFHDFLQGLPYAFEFESYNVVLTIAGWVTETPQERTAYVKRYWEDADDTEQSCVYYNRLVWMALWRLSQKNKVEPGAVPMSDWCERDLHGGATC